MKKLTALILIVALTTGCDYVSPAAQRVVMTTPTPTSAKPEVVQPTSKTPTETSTATPMAKTTLTGTPTAPTAPPQPASAGYPIAGQRYKAWINGSEDTSGQYDAVWTNDGWLWQPNLPPEGQRSAFDIALTIENGNYTFSGVSCDLYLDTERTGKGAVGKPTLGRGNNLPFVVNTKDGGQAWAVVVCKDNDKNDVVGFSIQYQGPLHWTPTQLKGGDFIRKDDLIGYSFPGFYQAGINPAWISLSILPFILKLIKI